MTFVSLERFWYIEVKTRKIYFRRVCLLFFPLSHPMHAQVYSLFFEDYTLIDLPHKNLLTSITPGEWSSPPECPELIVSSSSAVINHMLSCAILTLFSCCHAYSPLGSRFSSCLIAFSTSLALGVGICYKIHPRLLEGTDSKTFSDSPFGRHIEGQVFMGFWLFP